MLRSQRAPSPRTSWARGAGLAAPLSVLSNSTLSQVHTSLNCRQCIRLSTVALPPNYAHLELHGILSSKKKHPRPTISAPQHQATRLRVVVPLSRTLPTLTAAGRSLRACPAALPRAPSPRSASPPLAASAFPS